MFSENIVNNASGAVALLFRKIINDNKLNNLLETLIDVYADNNSKNSQEKSKIKTNYNTHVDKGKMSIKIFIMVFKEILKVKDIEFSLDIKYDNKIYTASLKVDMENYHDTVSVLFKKVLKLGLNNDLDKKLDIYASSITETNNDKFKKKYSLMQQINSSKMSFKTMVLLFHKVFECEYLTLSVLVKHGKNNLISDVTLRF